MTFRHVWPFRKNTAGIRVLFAGIGWETSTELSTTQPSTYRVPATSGRLPMHAETSSFALSRKQGVGIHIKQFTPMALYYIGTWLLAAW